MLKPLIDKKNEALKKWLQRDTKSVNAPSINHNMQ